MTDSEVFSAAVMLGRAFRVLMLVLAATREVRDFFPAALSPLYLSVSTFYGMKLASFTFTRNMLPSTFGKVSCVWRLG